MHFSEPEVTLLSFLNQATGRLDISALPTQKILTFVMLPHIEKRLGVPKLCPISISGQAMESGSSSSELMGTNKPLDISPFGLLARALKDD